MAEAAPLDAEEFLRLLAPLVAQGARGIVLAVSGGPDSMALLHCAAEAGHGGALPRLTVGTVDHGLRPGSEAAAALVEDAARARGLPVRRLAWTGPKPARAVQERAREARYGLLGALCNEVDADHLVTAHTLDDQAETVLFRLLRGSGVGGLAAMRPVLSRGGLRHIRPLLGIAKARLVATCARHGVPVHDDPANGDPRFARARMRRLLPLLAAEHCGAPVLARLAMRAARAEDALVQATDAAFGSTRIDDDGAVVRLDAARLSALPPELALRVLGRAIVASGRAPIRQLDGLEHSVAALTAAARRGHATRTTLGGALLTLTARGVIEIAREGPRRRGLRAVPPRAGGAVTGEPFAV